jgi:CRISPR-associated protein Csc3
MSKYNKDNNQDEFKENNFLDFEKTDDEESMDQLNCDSLDLEDLGFSDEPQIYTIKTDRELLTLKLLRQAIAKTNPDDRVLEDFAEYVLPNLLKYAIGVSAKGGWFFDELDRQVARGERSPLSRRDNAADQSLNTHLLNGLFPANAIERRLQKLNTNVKLYVRDHERRIGFASFILHDFEKFDLKRFADLDVKLISRYDRNLDTDLRKASIDEHRQLFNTLVPSLGLDRLIDPENPENWKVYRDDLLYVAYNTQVKNDTNLNLSDTGLQPELRDRTLSCLIDLTRLADLLASIVKHPHDATAYALKTVLHDLSGGQLRFTYHAIAENRGVLTNIVNNAVMDAYDEVTGEAGKPYTPLLYLPTGVIYLATRDAPAVARETLPDRVVAAIKARCAQRLIDRQTGFSRDGKGIKYADYYSQFFTDRGLMEVACCATLRILKSTKPSKAKERSKKLLEFQKQGVLSDELDVQFGDDIRIDRIAEFGDVVTRKIWGDRREKIEAHLKSTLKGKDVKVAIANLPNPNLIEIIVREFDLDSELPALREIQRINETLKSLRLKGNTGGVPLDWYYLAAKYIARNPSLSRDEGDIGNAADRIIEIVDRVTAPIIAEYDISDGWDDLREWTRRVVMLPDDNDVELRDRYLDSFRAELNAYEMAKKPGRGRQLICSISHSPDSVTEQMESSVLFTPQVYTNKQMLGGSNAKRNISSIAGTEMMLRQILMNQTQAIGKKFEDGKYRYLYFYPTYYFTPETNNFLARAYSNIAQTRFDTSIRGHFIDKESLIANFELENYQTVDEFLIDENLKATVSLSEDDQEQKLDRTFKLSYPEDKPLTFFFIALPPGREPTDTESWVMPSWIALVMPSILDVKTVVSESPIPPYRDGAEFEETVFLDSPPQAFRSLLGRDRFRINHILEGWRDDRDRQHPSPLNTLTAAYAIHLDVNPKRNTKGYDANWGKLAKLASDLETSPLYVFHYLAKFARSIEQDSKGQRTVSDKRIQLYLYDLYTCFDSCVEIDRKTPLGEDFPMTSSPLNHPRKLVQLYRKFYRAERKKGLPLKTNAILKPLKVAADTLLKADHAAHSLDALSTIVIGEVSSLMNRVGSNTAEGKSVVREILKKKGVEAAMQELEDIKEFCQYFVFEVFAKSFNSDRARLAGRQINLIYSACEFIYRDEDFKNYQEYKNKSQEDLDAGEEE